MRKTGLDGRELRDVQRALKKLSPKNDKRLKQNIRAALKKSAKPMVTALKQEITKTYKKNSKGQLKKSIAAIAAKRERNGVAVYVGARVKNAFRAKDKTGFYFYFLSERGFTTGFSKKGQKRKKGPKYDPDNLLAKMPQHENAVYQQIDTQVQDIIARKCLKLGFNFG